MFQSRRFVSTVTILLRVLALLIVVTHGFPLLPKQLQARGCRLPSLYQPSIFLTSTTALADKPNIEVISQPDAEFLEKEGCVSILDFPSRCSVIYRTLTFFLFANSQSVFRWGTWGCLPGKFPWSYGENESCYLLSGKVTVTPVDGRPAVTFEKGDFVTFPAGLSCEWDVTESVQKHFKFF